MSFTWAILLAIIAPTVGVGIFAASKVFDCLNKGYKKVIRNILLVVGLAIYISFLIVVKWGVEINSQTTYTEYPVQYLTTNRVYFDNNDGYSLQEGYVIVEEPTSEHENIVVVETLKYETQWLWKLPIEKSKFHIYLSDENYKRLQNKDVIYENR